MLIDLSYANCFHTLVREDVVQVKSRQIARPADFIQGDRHNSRRSQLK
jgi:hypothetical protein